MKIKLKKDWDLPAQLKHSNSESEVGHFVGRANELLLLSNEIAYNVQGNILISGYRGVGKTSLVYKAINQAYQKNSNIIPVVINAAQLEAEQSTQNSKTKISPDKIIKNLIRRLYSGTQIPSLNKDIVTDISKLYNKAIAKDYLSKENRNQIENQSVTKKIINESRFLINQEQIKFIVHSIFTPIIFIIISLIKPTLSEFIKIGLSFLLTIPLPFIFKKSIIKIQTRLVHSDNKILAEELYEFDASIGNLEYDLEMIHQRIYKEEKKIVYVIDELDKLDYKDIKEVLKFFKNLFTVSKALFIFIGDEELYDGIKDEKPSKSYRSKEYTYFTSKFFLSRPEWKDIDKFLDEIIITENLDEKLFKDFKSFLAFESKGDFFDLLNLMRDYINDYDQDGCPILTINELKSNEISKSKFNLLINSLYVSKLKSGKVSNWRENEIILQELYDNCTQISNSYAGSPYNDKTGESITDMTSRYLNSSLYRLGVFNLVGSEKPRRINGVNVSLSNYSYSGAFNIEMPKTIHTFTEIEQLYCSSFEDLVSVLLQFNTFILKTRRQTENSQEVFLSTIESFISELNNKGISFGIPISQYLGYYFQIRSFESFVDRNTIENQSREMISHKKQLLTNSYVYLAKLITWQYPEQNFRDRGLANADFYQYLGSNNRILFQSNSLTLEPIGKGFYIVVTNKNRNLFFKDLEENKALTNIMLLETSNVANAIIVNAMISIDNKFSDFECPLIDLAENIEKYLK